MTWVKICGITNLEDALVAVEAGADAVGFVFHQKSPRKVDKETVRAIAAALPARVERVGVFVEQGAEEIRQIMQSTGLSAAQLHGSAEAEDILAMPGTPQAAVGTGKVILVLPAEKMAEADIFLPVEMQSKVFAILVDSGSREKPGGTGQPFDWDMARRFVHGLSGSFPVIVAGGLSASNVTEAIDIFKPWGVDVVSGVEAHPGKKDSAKVRAFVEAVREADQRAG
jgi:phosphoribosylanthranilate isomerase